jgi:hypothetical protein
VLTDAGPPVIRIPMSYTCRLEGKLHSMGAVPVRDRLENRDRTIVSLKLARYRPALLPNTWNEPFASSHVQSIVRAELLQHHALLCTYS